MLRITACALLIPAFSLSATRLTFDLRGEVLPHEAATVELHAVATPYAVSTLAGPDGHFRFKDIQPGAYTLLIATRFGKELRKTVEVSRIIANRRGQIALQIRADGQDVNRETSTTVSARQIQVSERAVREYNQAQKKITARDFDGARSCLRRAVEIEPRFAAAWNHLGTMAYQDARYAEAETDFRRGLDADPSAYEPLVNLGGVLLNLGKFEEALQYNNEAIKRRPNDALAQSQLGMTYVYLTQLDSAEKHLSEATRLDPSHFSHPQLLLAEVYLHKNNPSRAAEQLENFLRWHPDWPSAAKMRAQITTWRSLSEQGSPQSVRESLR